MTGSKRKVPRSSPAPSKQRSATASYQLRPHGLPLVEAYIGGRWHKAELYEMDLLQPGNEVSGPAIIEHPATTLVVHPGDHVHVDEWTLLHYRHG